MPSFGQQLRYYRRECRDPQRGGLLTQERLGELLGVALGDTGYSAAAVSDWELDKSKIGADYRLVLVNLVGVLQQCGGLHTPAEADELLGAGNYRALDANERSQVFPNFEQGQEVAVSPAPHTSPVAIQATTTPLPAQQIAISRHRRKQLILLQKVKNFWVEGVLERSIHEASLLELSMRRCDQVIDHPWQAIIGPAVFEHENPAGHQTVQEYFLEADRALLILGEPGAGKTMTLIMLARELIAQAENDPSQPIPVILNLASWPEQQLMLSRWVVEELMAKYQIPRKTAAKWLEDDDLLLLLDGLDEVPDRSRPRCIKAINHFREVRGLTGLSVCSRTEEYQSAGELLKLSGAVALDPLSSSQIDAYLESAGPRLDSLKKAVNQDMNLEELARSPLMLSVMGQAYSYSQDDLAGILSGSPDTAEATMDFWRRHLFETYVQSMFQRRSTLERYSPEKTERWLGWLAREMFAHSPAHFLIEKMQPSWLPDRRRRWIYILLSGIFTGLVGGVITWLFLQLLRESNPFLPAPLSGTLANFLQIAQGRAEALTLILANIILGLVMALLQGFYYERLLRQQTDPNVRGWSYWRHLLLIGLAIGSLTAAVVALAGLSQLALVWAIVEVILYMTAARYVYGRSYQDEIRTVEALGWSWPQAAKGLAVGLLFALIAETFGKLLYSAPVGFRSSVILGIGGLILGGLRGRRVETNSRPNQGIVLSLRNSFIAALFSGLLIALITLLVYSPDHALLTGVLTFIIAGSLLGGSNVVKHLLVRSLLWLNGEIPWRYTAFLDYAASLAFLRKVGGSYIFLHRLLQTYFASKPPPLPRLSKKATHSADRKRALLNSRSTG